MSPGHEADHRIASVVSGSVLRVLPSEATDRLLADSLLVDVPAGGTVCRNEDAPRTGLVVTGLVRVFPTAVETSSFLTVRYARPGATPGPPTAIK